MSIHCGKIFKGGNAKSRQTRFKDHKEQKHESLKINAPSFRCEPVTDQYTAKFKEHNVHRINIPDVKTSTLRRQALEQDLQKWKHNFLNELTEDANYEEHDLSFLSS